MDRGYVQRGGYRLKNYNPNFNRDRADRSDRRYDDFYADRDRRAGPPGPNRSAGGRYNSNKPWNNRRGGGPPRVGDKRRGDNYNKYAPSEKKGRDSNKKDDKEETKLVEEVVPDIPDDEVVVPDSLMDSVELLRQRKEIERNAADEDTQKLVVFCFTGKGYQCQSCGLLLTKESSFVSHLDGKSHVMNVITARTAKKYQDVRDILDIDLSSDDWFEQNEKARSIIMKQSKMHMKAEREAKAKEEANYNITPSNFFGFNMELRKSVAKKDDKVVISSLVESTVEVSDFTGERFFGCEFVRAVTGFHCRLCSINIREAKGVLPHIDSRQHKNNYSAYVKRNADYEKLQKEQSEDLFNVMTEHDGKNVVLAESANVADSHFLSVLDKELVRIPTVMNPELKKKEKEEKERKEKEEKEQKEKEEKEQKEKEEKEKKDEDAEENEEDEVETENVDDDENEEKNEEEENTKKDEEEEPSDETVEDEADESKNEEETEEAAEEAETAEDDKEEEAAVETEE